MDCSQFILDSFESKDWINSLISSIPPDCLEKELTDHVIKLQFYMQEMNNVVDDSIQNAFQSLPRVMRDLESVRQEAVALHEQMSLVKLEIEKVEKSTQESMCSLLKIDAQKKRLSQVEKALQEADSWTQICDNIDTIMQSGDLNKIVDKISSLQHSLSMLTAAPDYEDRKTKVEQLCQNFLSLLGPQLIQAFFNSDSEFIRVAFDHLATLNQTDRGSQYYNAWFKPYVADMWTQCHSDQEGGQSEDLLKAFFDKLLSFCRKERERHIFHDAERVLMTAVTEALIHLDSSMDKIVSRQYPDISDPCGRMVFLTNCIKVVDNFSVELEMIIDGGNSGAGKVDPDVIRKLSSIIYSQYRGVNDLFATDCKTYVLNKINSIKMDSAEVSDCIDVLDLSVDKVVDLARDAVKYCLLTTHFTAVDYLADIIKELFSLYVKEFQRVCLNITLKLSNQNHQTSVNKSENVDHSIEDYYFIQDGIRLTSIGGHISSKFEQFLQEMLTQIGSHIQELNNFRIKKRIFVRNYPEVFVESKKKQKEMSEFWLSISTTTSHSNLLKWPFLAVIEETRQTIKFQLLRWLNKTVFDGAIEPVKRSLSDVSRSVVWQEELDTGEPLPQFAYSPQEYITRIGQYFMTLPQQLEPFINENNTFYHESLLNGQLPHLSSNFLNTWLDVGDHDTTRPSIQVAHVWLESIVLGSLSHLMDQWLAIECVSVTGRQQLMADLNYIVGLVEDLGLPVSGQMRILQQAVASSSKDTILDHMSPSMADFVNRLP